MTRRRSKQDADSFYVASNSVGEVWAVADTTASCDDPESHEMDEGIPVVALFATEQTARQFADKRGLLVTRMHVHSSMRSIY